MSCCSSRVGSEPRSTTRQRGPDAAELVEHGAFVPRSPHLPAVDAEVLDPPTEHGGLTFEQFPKGLGGGRQVACLLEELDEIRVLVAIVDRVEAEDSRLGLRVELGKAQSQPLAPPIGSAAHDDPRRSLPVAVREPLVDALP